MIHDWGKDNTIKPHSINKLDLLWEYYKEFLVVLGKGGYRRTTFPLCFVDAFCGGGMYVGPDGESVLGSPLRTLEAALQFEIAVNQPNRKINNRFKFFFFDEDQKAIDRLVYELNKYKRENSIPRHWEIKLNTGKFEDMADQVIQAVKKHSSSRRALFFLDQYGYSKVKIHTLYKILSELRQAEIILAISTDWLADHTDYDNQRIQLIEIGFAMDSVDRHIQKLKDGPDSDLMPKAQYERNLCQKLVVDEITSLKLTEKLYFSPYCIKSPASNKNYVFLHISRNLRAREVMISKQWEIGSRGGMVHEGPSGLNSLVFEAHGGQGYMFGDEDKKRSLSKLEGELLDQLRKVGKTTALGMYAPLANSVIVPKKDLYEVLKKLYRDGAIIALTPKGNPIQKCISDETQIELPPHKQISLPWD